MKIAPTQNQTFGAIKIKGYHPNYTESMLIKKAATTAGVACGYGEDYMCNQSFYILSKKGSELEKMLLETIKKLKREHSDIKIKTCSDIEAQKNVARFDNEKPSIRQFFNWL